MHESNNTPAFKKADAKAYFWLGALALLGVPARAADISLLQYALIFLLACFALLATTIMVRKVVREGVMRDAIAATGLVSVATILIYPMRSVGTPLSLVALLWLAMLIVVLSVGAVCRRGRGQAR